jgi:DNA repair protein RadA/Sms
MTHDARLHAMAKTQTRYVCQSCGHESPRWQGKCPDCDAWNSFVEEVRVVEKAASLGRSAAGAILPGASGRPVPITEVAAQTELRLSSGIGELDRVLGGGIVRGGLTLVGGDPGIGKSTLMTQVAHAVAGSSGATVAPPALGDSGGRAAPALDDPTTQRPNDPTTVLYVSGEESIQQIKLRSERLGPAGAGFLVVNETDIGAILHHVEAARPAVVVVDSIQTTYDSSLESAPGTVSQIRNCAAALARAAKSGGPPIFLIGHVTKEGSLAGPRVLEHMVDTVLYFEGDRHHAYRILRAVKNRFGSTDEIGIFEMREGGLAEVENPSAVLLAERTADASGSAVTATLEGSRPLLVEIQALVARSFLANPRRTATGIELNRLHMLLAVLEKRIGLKLAEQDVYVNVAGGVRLVEPATDLAVTMAVASNFRDQPVDPNTILLGEVGLGGEVRAVAQAEKRIREAARLGFTRAVLSRHNAPRAKNLGVEVIPVNNVLEAIKECLLPPRE